MMSGGRDGYGNEIPYGTPHLSFILLKKHMYMEERFHIIPIHLTLVSVVVAAAAAVVVNLGSETSMCVVK